MSRRFIISDTHFDHGNSITRWKKPDGVTPYRPFASIEEADETMLANWNRVVGKNDLIYHLGDVAFSSKGLAVVKRLAGRKRLILGNHDEEDVTRYLDAGFESVAAIASTKVNDLRIVLTHIPIHPFYVTERWDLNIHGHLHDSVVMTDGGVMLLPEPDPRYICASVERIEYTPILLETLVQRHINRTAPRG